MRAATARSRIPISSACTGDREGRRNVAEPDGLSEGRRGRAGCHDCRRVGHCAGSDTPRVRCRDLRGRSRRARAWREPARGARSPRRRRSHRPRASRSARGPLRAARWCRRARVRRAGARPRGAACRARRGRRAAGPAAGPRRAARSRRAPCPAPRRTARSRRSPCSRCARSGRARRRRGPPRSGSASSRAAASRCATGSPRLAGPWSASRPKRSLRSSTRVSPPAWRTIQR